MTKPRRSFSVEQKLHLIQEADQQGITQTLRKHNLSHSVFQRWKNQFNSGDVPSLKPQYHKVDPEIRALQEENARLKKIIGNQALELEFKTELLKKAMPTTRIGKLDGHLSAKGCFHQEAGSVVSRECQHLLLQSIREPKRNIQGWNKHVLLLTVMDIYSRKVLIHMLKANIKKGDVLVMLSLMLLEYKAEGMSLRNDNGSQFIAQAVRQYLKEKGILQEFSHVATPEDNAFIEALHSNLQREVIDRFEFDSLYHAQLIIDRYYKWYNSKRRHGSLQRKTPNAVYDQYFNPNPFEN